MSEDLVVETRADSVLEGELSVVIPITERYDDAEAVYDGYKKALGDAGYLYHFVYVLDGSYPEAASTLRRLIAEGEPISIIQMARYFGEATALAAGFEAARSDRILTLPAYVQIEFDEVARLVAELEDCDMVVARRIRSRDTFFNRLQSSLFNWGVRTLTGEQFHDLGCGAKALRRSVAADLHIYGDQHRFLPLLAKHGGWRVREIACKQAESDRRSRRYGPGIYVRRMLDLLTVFFLVKFTKKPLRFFGLIGSVVFFAGVTLAVILAVQRLWFDVALADRPILLLATLLAVLGIQIIAIGLIGEIIIFTHARDVKEYNVELIVNGSNRSKTVGSEQEADNASVAASG